MYQNTAAGSASGSTIYYASNQYTDGLWYDRSGYKMKVWLQRRASASSAWATIAGPHNMTTGTSWETDHYYDGGTRQIRACFQFTSWSGAAWHCTTPY